MWIVTHGLGTVRTLSERERELLQGFVEGSLLGQAEAHANTLLRRIRSESHWLACDCIKPMPVLNVAMMNSGKLILRNNPDGHQHLKGCAFSHDLIKDRTSSRPDAHSVNRITDDGHVALHSEFYDTSKGLGPKISRSDAPKPAISSKKLLALSMSFLERAGLAVYSPAAKLSIGDQFEALRRSARTYTMSPGVPLNNYLDTRITKQRLVAMSVKLRGSKEFAQSRRVGLLLDLITGAKGRTLHLFGGTEVEFFGHIERVVSPSYPALALATVTSQAARTSFFELANVATIPVLSKTCMFPVISDHDRECVFSVFGLIDWFLSTKKIEITAVRHIFSAEANDLLELRSSKLIMYVGFQNATLGETAPPSSAVEVLRLSDFESLSGLKKAITKRFLGVHHA